MEIFTTLLLIGVVWLLIWGFKSNSDIINDVKLIAALFFAGLYMITILRGWIA